MTPATSTEQGLHSPAASSAAELRISTAAVSSMLLSLGVDLTDPLAASMILGSFDVLAAVEIGAYLPEEFDFHAALMTLHTFANPQPQKVRAVQLLVMEALGEAGVVADLPRHAAIKTHLLAV